MHEHIYKNIAQALQGYNFHIVFQHAFRYVLLFVAFFIQNNAHAKKLPKNIKQNN